MRVYEATMILNPEMEEEQLTQVQDKFSEIITKTGAEIVNVENWGKRRLAYEINGKTEGVYVIYRFNSDTDTANTLKRDFAISDHVIKAMIIKLN